MNRNISSCLMPFFFLLFSHGIFAQNIDSMMQIYAKRLAPERIHLHFDKNIYNTGETVWYKAYILQGTDTSVISKNLYIEWYGSDGKSIRQTVSPIVYSSSSGSFDIPPDYNGDLLEVRAFTRWMLNDDTAFLYRRQLVININKTKLPIKTISKTIVTVFPEGGNLFEGLRSRIAFKATNSFGIPVLIKAVVTDEINNIIDSLQVQHDGMGSFFMTAMPKHKYQLNWTDENGFSGITPIVVLKSEGVQMTILKKEDKVLFNIERSENVSNNFMKMNMIIHMNRVGLYRVAINTTEKKNINAAIPIGDLPTGLLQFTLFSSDWIPIAERVMFINNGSHEFDVNLSTASINVDARGKNIIDLFVLDTFLTNMSIAITDDAITTTPQHTIFSDFFLSSDINGKVFNPSYYMSGNTDKIASDLDLVMLTNGWRRFDWEKIKAHIPPKMKYPIENEYIKLIGKVSGIPFDKPIDLNMIIISKDSSRQFVTTTLQTDGRFEQSITLFDTAKILYSINNDPSLSVKTKLIVQNGLMQLSPKKIQPFNNETGIVMDIQVKKKIDDLWAKQELLRKKMSKTTLKEVIITSKIKTKEENLDQKYSSGFFKGNPAKKSYILDLTDPKMTTSANTIFEYLENRIPGLIAHGNGSMQWRGSSPILYLNEVRADIGTLSTIPLINVAMIKAFPPIFMFAAGGGAGGAIAVYTKVGIDYTPPEPLELQSTQLAGYTMFKEFFNPNYEQPENGFVKPDNRTTLYWNPNLFTNSSQQNLRLEFFNNDFTKTFKVVIEGINAAGKMMHKEKKIYGNVKVE